MFDDAFAAIARDGAGMIEVQIRLQKAFIALAQFNAARYGSDARRHAERAIAFASAAIPIETDIERLRTLAKGLHQP